jgi:hypothetical protein
MSLVATEMPLANSNPRPYVWYFLEDVLPSALTIATQNAGSISQTVASTFDMPSVTSQAGMNASVPLIGYPTGYSPYFTYQNTQNMYAGISALSVSAGNTNSATIFSLMSLETASPPLTDDEIIDITKSWEEIRTGKSKKFDNASDAIEWLHSQRAKHTK